MLTEVGGKQIYAVPQAKGRETFKGEKEKKAPMNSVKSQLLVTCRGTILVKRQWQKSDYKVFQNEW